MNEQAWHIRRYENGDAAAVWDLHVTGLKDAGAYTPAGTQDEDLRDVAGTYLRNRGEFLVAVARDVLIGMGAIQRASDDVAEVKRMRVDAGHRRQGVAEAIYDRLETTARELGYSKLVLDTTVQQVAAQALYGKKGFAEAGRTTVGGFQCILFEKKIS